MLDSVIEKPDTLVQEVDFREALAAIRKVRFTVFVDEQKVPAEIEMDEWDERSRHVLALRNGEPVGTGRLLPDGHIGRVAVLKECRGTGVGQAIMRTLMEMGRRGGMRRIELSAQLQAFGFYEQLGFRKKGDVYWEAGIEHVAMELELSEHQSERDA